MKDGDLAGENGEISHSQKTLAIPEQILHIYIVPDASLGRESAQPTEHCFRRGGIPPRKLRDTQH
jgi:hypothetical protein